MKKSVFLVIVLFLSVNSIFAQPELNITVGSWNIEHLGNAKMRSSFRNNIAQTPEDIADYIRQSKVDVLALQEIYDTDLTDERKNETLDEAVSILNSGGNAKWTYRIFPNRNWNSKRQLAAVAWNEKTIRMVGVPYRLRLGDIPRKPFYWDRYPWAVKFARVGIKKTDFVLISVHMKANVGGFAKTSQQRAKEAEYLIGQVPAIMDHFKDRDLIVIGDFNTLRNDEDAIKRFVDAGFNDLNKNQATHGKNPFDRAFVTIKNSPEFTNARLDVFEMPGLPLIEFIKRFSDHKMIRFLVQVTTDDD